MPVLEGLSLDVAAGSIYGLLGPSGCGKTTLLSCCLGVLAPKSGQVLLFGKRPHAKGETGFQNFFSETFWWKIYVIN